MKKLVEIVCTSKKIFTGKIDNKDKQYQVKQQAVNIRKGIFIDYLVLEALVVKRLIKGILISLFWEK